MTTLLPKDADNHPIPALRLKPGGAQQVSASGTSARNAVAFAAGTQVIGLYATKPVYIALGDGTITATTADHYLPEGVYYDLAIAGGRAGAQATHIAVRAVGDNGTVYISEKE